MNYLIENMTRDAETGIVKNVSFIVSKTDGKFLAETSDSVELAPPTGTPIPYDKLTPEVVIGWVKEQVGDRAEKYKKLLDFIIERQKNPPVPPATGLPWDKK
jgi:hypothetical protein